MQLKGIVQSVKALDGFGHIELDVDVLKSGELEQAAQILDFRVVHIQPAQLGVIRRKELQRLGRVEIAAACEGIDLCVRERRDPDGGVGVAEIGVADALDGAEGRKIVGIQVEVVDADAETVLLAGLAEITVCQGRQIVDAGVGDVDPAQLAEILNPPDRVDLRAP